MENGRKNGIRRKKTGWARIAFPLLTLLCFAGVIGSLLFPNRVLDTYIMNMEEEEGDTLVLLPLSYEKPIRYEIKTIAGPLQGVQLGINKQGLDLSGTFLRYRVFVSNSLVSDNRYDLSQGDDLQYVYLPFEHPESCVGDLRVELMMEADGTADPEKCAFLEANHRAVKDTLTGVYEGIRTIPEDPDLSLLSLRGSHIYSHDTYPFLYDMRILFVIFLALTMTLSFKGRRNGG